MLSRIVIIVLGWPVLMLALLTGYDAYRALEARRLTADGPVIVPVSGWQHPAYRVITERALNAFEALPAQEQTAVRANLRAQLLGLDRWLTETNRSTVAVYCLAEDHHEATRDFLARAILPGLALDTLMLEIRPPLLAEVLARVDDGHDYAALLDADIAAVVRAARARDPQLAIVAVEQTQAQRDRGQPRDAAIADNVAAAFRAGDKHAVLMGALHCGRREHRLYRRLPAHVPALRRPGSVRSVRILPAHAEGSLEAFVAFLDALGLASAPFVIDRPAQLHSAVREWFLLLEQPVLAPYDAVIVYRQNGAHLAVRTPGSAPDV